MIHFILRNIVATFLTPTPFIGILLIVGIVLLIKNKIKVAKILLSIAGVLLILFSLDPLPEALLNAFENKYPPFQKAALKEDVKYVVVLAGGYVPYEGHPLTTQLTKFTLVRLVEGIKIYRELPGTKLVVTGKGWATQSEAEAMGQMAESLGVPKKDIILETESMNTKEHTEFLKPILKSDPFILVTSALHMPRAMLLFSKAGFNPHPAPTQHILTGKYNLKKWPVLYPKGDNLDAMDLWALEFWGYLQAKIL
jgi:uncharacterized SAM-binding protein YcdF (DUF218 family)